MPTEPYARCHLPTTLHTPFCPRARPRSYRPLPLYQRGRFLRKVDSSPSAALHRMPMVPRASTPMLQLLGLPPARWIDPRLWSCAVIGGLPIRLVESSPRAAWHYKPSEPRSPSSRPQWYLASAASPRPTPQGYGHSPPWSAGLTLCHPQQCAISAQEPQSPPEAAMLPRCHWVCTYSASRASCPLILLASTQYSAVLISIHSLHPHATGIYNSCHGTPAVLCPRDCDNLQVPLAAAGLYTFSTNSFSKTTSIHRGTFIWRLRLGS